MKAEKYLLLLTSTSAIITSIEAVYRCGNTVYDSQFTWLNRLVGVANGYRTAENPNLELTFEVVRGVRTRLSLVAPSANRPVSSRNL